METTEEELVGIDSHSRLISLERFRILRSAGGTSVTQRDYFLRNLFFALKTRWIEATINYSSTEDIFSHSAGQRIVAYGPILIKYILDDLANSPYRWIVILQTITNENPVPEEHIGNIEAMISDWKVWGENNGF